MHKIKIILSLLLFASSCFAGTGGTFYIQEDGGGNYTSLANFEAGEQGVLNSSCVAIIQESWSGLDATVNFSGWTTYSTAPVIIITEGSARHSGVWSNTAYRGKIQISQLLHIQIDGLQLDANGDGAICLQGGSVDYSETKITNCIFINSHANKNGTGIWCSNVFGQNIKLKVINSIFYDLADGISFTNDGLLYVVLYNNTAVNCSNRGFNMRASTVLSQSPMQLDAKNNISNDCGNSGNMYLYGWDAGTQTNNLNNASPVSFVNQSARNLALGTTDIYAINQGLNLSTDTVYGFNTDIAGTARQSNPANWDIGAFKYTAQATAIKRKKYITWVE